MGRMDIKAANILSIDYKEHKFEDMAELLFHVSDYDSLTGLLNRRGFQRKLRYQLNKEHTHGAMILIDLDRFKYVNEIFGCQVGDALLLAVVGCIRQKLQANHLLTRLGDDEFAIVLPGAGKEVSEQVADQLLRCFREDHHLVGGHEIAVRISMGMVYYPEHGTTIEQLLINGSIALNDAKNNGWDQLCVFRPDIYPEAAIEAKFKWSQRLKTAIVEGGFVLYCQPIMHVKNHFISEYELLLRMVDDAGVVAPPAVFMGFAEPSDMHAIDRYVVEQAIRLLTCSGEEIRLAINLYGRAYEDADLLPLIQNLLVETGVNPASLIFEITESAAVADLGKAQKFIEVLRSMGCLFALDDFGSGFSSFTYLKHLKVDFLKIDGSFIRNLRSDPVNHEIVKAIVQVARGLGIKTVAEFVENEETVCFLYQYGVDYVQGYYIGKPRPASDLLNYYAPPSRYK